jgi:hypothetical protein
MVPRLTDYEMKLVTDQEVLLTKNKVIQKVYELFGGLSEEYKELLKNADLITANEVSAKISRGENYRGLPYVILDYPRQFGKVDVLAIRTFFWWGNFFSITLQLSGEHQQKYAVAIEKAIHQNLFEGWFIGMEQSLWEHHFEVDNYAPVQQGKEYNVSDLPFLKLAKKIPLNKWDNVEFFLRGHFAFLMKVLCS